MRGRSGEMHVNIIHDHRQLKVYQKAFTLSMKIYELSKTFPKEELYSLTDQIRRSSRSVCSNIVEAFRRRIYPRSFASKLNESEAEAAESQNWLDFALECKFINPEIHCSCRKAYDEIIGMLVNMRRSANKWGLK